jgi:hypothetical protein
MLLTISGNVKKGCTFFVETTKKKSGMLEEGDEKHL